MYDVTKLKTIEQCKTVMENAKKRNRDDVYALVFKRMCELAGKRMEDPDDPVIKDFYQVLAAYEQALTEKNGKTTIASRTRQKLENKGVYQCLIDWSLAPTTTSAFDLLLSKGLSQFTGEYVVVKHKEKFPEAAVAQAINRLQAHNIALP